MRSIKILSVLGVSVLMLAGEVWAHGYGRTHYPRSRVEFGVYVGSPWVYSPYPRYAYPTYGPYIYVPSTAPVVVTPPAPSVYIEQPVSPPPAVITTLESGYWYFCQEVAAYYPYVKECPQGWQQVPAQPADLERR